MHEAYGLVEGPQGGAKVKACHGPMPQTIYVGLVWVGHGYVAWGREKCDSLPYRYDKDGDDFVFRQDKGNR